MVLKLAKAFLSTTLTDTPSKMRRFRNISNQSLSIPFQTPEGSKTLLLTKDDSIEVPDSWTSNTGNNLRDRQMVQITNLNSESFSDLSVEELVQKTRALFGGGEPGGGEPGGGQPGGGGGGAGSNPDSTKLGTCWEVMAVHISFLVEYKWEPRYDGRRPVETGRWTTERFSSLYYAPQLGSYRFGLGHQFSNIYKECVCLTGKESFGINGITLGAFGLPYNRGSWLYRKNIEKLVKTGFKYRKKEAPNLDPFLEGGLKLEGADLIAPSRAGDYGKDQYVYTSFTKGCSDCVVEGAAKSTSCECNGFQNVYINLDDQSKTYEASNGEIITFSKPGNRKQVIEEVMAAEQAIHLDCNK